MSDVKRQKVFWDDGGETIKRFHEVDAVLASDYDALASDNKRLREALEFIARLHIIPPYMTPQASQLILMKGHADAALASSNGGVMDADLKAERNELRVQVEAMRLLLQQCDKDITEDGGVYIELRAFLLGTLPASEVIALLSDDSQ